MDYIHFSRRGAFFPDRRTCNARVFSDGRVLAELRHIGESEFRTLEFVIPTSMFIQMCALLNRLPESAPEQPHRPLAVLLHSKSLPERIVYLLQQGEYPCDSVEHALWRMCDVIVETASGRIH